MQRLLPFRVISFDSSKEEPIAWMSQAKQKARQTLRTQKQAIAIPGRERIKKQLVLKSFVLRTSYIFNFLLAFYKTLAFKCLN